MLTAKNIIEMEESLTHNPEPRKRSTTIDEEKMSSRDWKPALASRRASVPMEIIIGENGKPIFTPAPVGSPIVEKSEKPVKRVEKMEKVTVTESRSSVKKRASLKKKAAATATTTGKKGAKDEKEKEREKESPDSPTLPLTNTLATCSIGGHFSTNSRSKQIENLPEYEISRRVTTITVRDAVIQTDLF